MGCMDAVTWKRMCAWSVTHTDGHMSGGVCVDRDSVGGMHSDGYTHMIVIFIRLILDLR